MVDWVNGFIIPTIEVTLIGGIVGGIAYIVGKAFYNGWSKAGKFIWKYKIRKKAYPEKTVKWTLDCMENGVGWYDAKKILMVKMIQTDQINETLWIYDRIINEFNNQKGGINNGRKHQRSDSKNEIKPTELPSFN
jgi:hypothetical protein